MVVARQGFGNRRVGAAVDDHLVKAHVEVMERLEVFFRHVALVEQRIALHQAFAQRRLCFFTQAAFGALSRRQTLQYPTHLHGAGDIVGTHRAHLITPATMAHQQAFLFQGQERHAHRHARDAEAFRRRDLHQPFAGRQLA
ncbi:hypothetical protein D3C76_1434320 [compost metagenome]